MRSPVPATHQHPTRGARGRAERSVRAEQSSAELARRLMRRRPGASGCVSVARLARSLVVQRKAHRNGVHLVLCGQVGGARGSAGGAPHRAATRGLCGGGAWRQAGRAHWSTWSPRTCRSPCPTSTARPLASTARCSLRQSPGTRVCSGASRPRPPSLSRGSPPLCPARHKGMGREAAVTGLPRELGDDGRGA